MVVIVAFLVAGPATAQRRSADDRGGAPAATRPTPPADWDHELGSIRDLRADTDRDFVPDGVGAEVLVSGRVTAGTGLVRADVAEVYIQDGTGGLRLLLPPGSPPVLTGDSVLVHGIAAFRFGMMEMEAPNIKVVPSEPRRFEPVELETVPLQRGGSGPDLEGHEGELVQIEGYVLQSDSTVTGHFLAVLVGTQTVQVFAYRMRASPVRFTGIDVGDNVRVRGVAAQHDMAAPFNGGYVVFPLADGDVRRVGMTSKTIRWIATGVVSLLAVALLWAGLLRREVLRRTRALVASQARYVHLFDAAADLVIVLDIPRGGIVTSANAAAQRALGVDSEGDQPDGRALLLTDVADDPAAATQHLRDAHARGTATAVLDLRCTDGRLVPFEIATRRLDTSDGTAHVAVARDVHDRRLYEHGLVEAMETAQAARAEADRARLAAEAADRLKGSIFSNLSHELRTPLTAILGYSDILCEELDGDLGEFAGMIRASGNRLLGTLTDVLDLTRLDSLTPASADEASAAVSFDAVAATRDAVAAHLVDADPKGLGLHFATDAPDAWVVHVPESFERVVSILIGNALKFTDAGEVRVSLFSAPEFVAVRVQDTGIGISENFLEEIFEPFRQESDGQDRGFEGSGLGLTVARRLTERMGGQIRVWSRRGEGSLFEVALPLVAPTAVPDQASQESYLLEAEPPRASRPRAETPAAETPVAETLGVPVFEPFASEPLTMEDLPGDRPDPTGPDEPNPEATAAPAEGSSPGTAPPVESAPPGLLTRTALRFGFSRRQEAAKASTEPSMADLPPAELSMAEPLAVDVSESLPSEAIAAETFPPEPLAGGTLSAGLGAGRPFADDPLAALPPAADPFLAQWPSFEWPAMTSLVSEPLAEARAAEVEAAEARAAEARAAEARDAEAQVVEQRVAEQRAAEAHAAEARAAEAKAAEQRAAEARAAEAKAAEAKAAQAKAAEAKAAEARAVEAREAEVKAAEMRAAEARAVEQRAAEQRAAEAQAAEARAAEARAAEMRAAEVRAAEVRAAEVKAAEEMRAAEQRAAEQRAAEARVAEAKAAEEMREAEAKAAEARAAEARAAEAKAAEAKAAEAKAAEAKAAEQRAA